MLLKIIATLYPFIILGGLVFIFKFFRLRQLTHHKLRIPDVFTFFLILGLTFFSRKLTEISILPYCLLILSGLALILLLLDLFYYKAFDYHRFLKLWWRISFIIIFLIYLAFIIVILF